MSRMNGVAALIFLVAYGGGVDTNIGSGPKLSPSTNETAAETTEKDEPAIQKLSAERDRLVSAYQAHPKRKFVSAATQDPEYRAYMQRWRLLIEKTASHNAPEELKHPLEGRAILSVSIARDGTIEDITVASSSNSKIEAAAVAVVRKAAPFPPIPDKDNIDFLVITRTFEFHPDSRTPPTENGVN